MSRAIPVYRELLKAANKAFKSDNTMLSASRTEIRSHFEVCFRMGERPL
jgi:hypothetical protein